MWNNLRSDLYRVLHMRAFYISIAIGLFVNFILLTSTGITINSNFSTFSIESNTFSDFLFYLAKSPTFQLIVLVFLCIFHNDEYDKGFAKNIMPIIYKKSTLVLERYLLCVIVVIMIWLAIMIPCIVIQLILTTCPYTSFNIMDLVIYNLVQILLLSAFASLLMMLNHLTRSKILIIVLATTFGALILYMGLASLCIWLLGNHDLMQYSIYELMGTLPFKFSWETHQTTFLVLIGTTLLYNGISYLILKKKDI